MSGKSNHETFTEEEIREWLVNQLAGELGLEPADIDVREPFESFGLSSREAVTLSGDLEDWLRRRLPPTLAWQYPTIESLARYLVSGKNLQEETPLVPEMSESHPGTAMESSALVEPIAIIGIGCRFPGADGPEDFWRLLQAGVDAISEVPPGRWNVDEFYDPDPALPGKANTRWGGFINDIDQFDPQFFGISPREAARMDPQQRILLEIAWEALEDAGLVAEELRGTRTGVFVGISGNEYSHIQLRDADLIDAYAGSGNALSIAANRLSYFFNFQGPSIALDTACSSSLVAIHLACNSIWQGEANLALAGGVNLILSPAVTINFTKAGVMASDGRCKTFDARADGYVRSEGAGIVVLKPLSKALADGDPIYAQIRGSAVSHDGRSNGLMAPNPQAQEKVLRQALRKAGVTPDQIQFVEAHGTGTFLGDSIEAEALAAVLATRRPPGDYCAIGSVKTNIGHLEAAAGVAGLIKVALSLKYAMLPANLHYETPNPNIPFDQIPLRVQTKLSPWPKDSKPALAGVSSFGFGGTNAHVVLEEAPQKVGVHPNRAVVKDRFYLLPLSARSPAALQSQVIAYREYLQTTQGEHEQFLPDIGYTASLRRSHHDFRLAITGADSNELIDALEHYLSQVDHPGVSSGRLLAGRQHKLAFVFPGQGSQWVGMGQQLLKDEPKFREMLEACERALRPNVDWSLLAELTASEKESRLDQIDILQPALFAIQVSLATLWRSWGVQPNAVIGHSMGEIAAAYVAGALSLEEASRVICQRSRLLKQTSGQGAMLAVQLSLEDTRAALAGYEDRICVAVSNSPNSTVISGDHAALENLVDHLQSQEVLCRFVKVDVAAHSPQVELLKHQLEHSLDGLKPQAESVPIFSTVTGEAVQGRTLDAFYWRQNLREPVVFATTLQRMLDNGYNLFVEVSPHPILVSAIQQGLLHSKIEGHVFASLRRDENESRAMLASYGGLYTLGYPVDWCKLYHGGGQVLQLPTYPWQRQRYWLESDESSNSQNLWPGTGLVGRVAEPARISKEGRDWLCVLNWRSRERQFGESSPSVTQGSWLIFIDRQGVGQDLVAEMEAQGERCIRLSAGETFTRLQDDRFCIRPTSQEDLEQIFTTVFSPDQPACRGIIHLWSLDAPTVGSLNSADLETAQILACGSVLNLAQALDQVAWRRPPRLWLVTQGAQSVNQQGEPIAVAQAPLWGFGRTLALERPAIWGGLIDLDPASVSEDQAALLWEEIWSSDGADQIAFRQGQRYLPFLERPREVLMSGKPLHFRSEASYLITGGLGALGMLIARWLVDHGARHLVLGSRLEIPAKTLWDTKEFRGRNDRVARIIAAVRELERQGAEVRIAKLDISNQSHLENLLKDQRRNGYPPIRGVVHTAGILRDKSLSQLNQKTLLEVLRPKMIGAWLLHRQFSEQPGLPELDFLVFFSSAASLLGSPGQANYAAANAFLDAIAHLRDSQGQTALSINWGPWAEIGLAARPDRGERLAQYGVGSIPPQQGLKVLEGLIHGEYPQVGVISANWEKVSEHFSPTAGANFFESLLTVQDQPSSSQSLAPSPAILPSTGGQAQVTPTKAAPARAASLETYLRQQIAQILYLTPEEIPPERHFIELGLDSLLAMELIRDLERDFQIKLYPREIFEQPSIRSLAAYLSVELERQDDHGEGVPLQSAPPVQSSAFSGLVFGSLQPAENASQDPTSTIQPRKLNPAMAFLLSAPRSGSTLLRVMLAGHPDLFCPPELHLLQFEDMYLRHQGLGNTYLNEGLQRAFMELEDLDAKLSQNLLEDLVESKASIQEVYARLQQLAGSRLFVDKSPSYGSNLNTLERAEGMFKQPKYIFLTRHPYAAIESFVRNRFDKMLGAGEVDPWMLAELSWATINANVIDFLHQLPGNRWQVVKFEDLVSAPEPESRSLCEFLEIPYDRALLQPYQGKRMTDGVHAMSMGINDPGFLNHDEIDSSLGDVWKKIELPRRLGGFARRVARELNYDLPHEGPAWQAKLTAEKVGTSPEKIAAQEIPRSKDLPSSPIVEIQPMGAKRPLFFIHPGGGVVYPYYELARAMGKERPFYALQDLSLESEREPYTRIEDYAVEYLEAIRSVQPQGPYYLGGWSFGGHISVEMARRLVDEGQPVGLLFILDTEAPVAGRHLTLLQRLNYFKNRMVEYIRGAPDLVPYVRDALYLLSEAQRQGSQQLQQERLSLREYLDWAWTDATRRRLGRGAGIAQVIARDESLKQIRLPNSNVRRGLYILRRHIAIVNNFNPQVYQGNLILFRAEDQILRKFYSDWELGWGDLADSVEVHSVPGNHVTIFREPHVHAVAKTLQECVERFEHECTKSNQKTGA